MSVINDLSTDQRVHKHCNTLVDLGYDVLLIGRITSTSTPLEARSYKMLRMKLPFEKGPLFYASYNISLFFRLLFKKADLLFSNDLDTLLPNFLVSTLKSRPLIYDSHEFFTGVPELADRPAVYRIWKRLESTLIPKLKHMLTVNESIAERYRKEYGVQMKVMRNIPILKNDHQSKSRQELGLPEDKKIVILQGSGINIDRGAEEAVQAMAHVENAILLILGSGDVIGQLKQMVADLHLADKVIFKDRMPYDLMMAHTRVSDVGLTLDKDTNINYRYSLPNKLFDYIHAGIPTLGSDLKEVRNIIEKYKVGEVVHCIEPLAISERLNHMLHSAEQEVWRRNCIKAKEELSWQHESEILKAMVASIHG